MTEDTIGQETADEPPTSAPEQQDSAIRKPKTIRDIPSNKKLKRDRATLRPELPRRGPSRQK